uniref:Uncharacterized protein n=1 Tax=Romanomermis culicivorax TaxID=13658 RepID=A0A915IGY9_ROMCU
MARNCGLVAALMRVGCGSQNCIILYGSGKMFNRKTSMGERNQLKSNFPRLRVAVIENCDIS